MLLFPSRF